MAWAFQTDFEDSNTWVHTVHLQVVYISTESDTGSVQPDSVGLDFKHSHHIFQLVCPLFLLLPHSRAWQE